MSVKDLTKRQPFRSPKILKACHDPGLVCQVGFTGCLRSPTEPAHSNLAEDGKGAGQKADDIFVAIACRHCHDILDGRKKAPKEDYLDSREIRRVHQIAIKKSIRIFLDMKILK